LRLRAVEERCHRMRQEIDTRGQQIRIFREAFEEVDRRFVTVDRAIKDLKFEQQTLRELFANRMAEK
jgi:hypothetical protein